MAQYRVKIGIERHDVRGDFQLRFKRAMTPTHSNRINVPQLRYLTTRKLDSNCKTLLEIKTIAKGLQIGNTMWLMSFLWEDGKAKKLRRDF